MIPSTITGIHRGIIIANNDPEGMGRVKVFVPSANLALFEKWFSKDGVNSISINGLGANVNSYLTPDIMEKLHMYLPWSEVAQPMFGMGSGGTYSAPENTSKLGEKSETPCPASDTSAQNQPISSNAAETRKRFATELQNPEVREKFFTLMKAEVGGQGTQAQTAFAETVVNRATIQNKSINQVLSDQRYYAPYKDGGYAKARQNMTASDRSAFSAVLSNVQNGSNVSNGATHNSSMGFTPDLRKNTQIKGENFYSKTYEKPLNFTNNPTTGTEPTTPIITPPTFVDPNCQSNTPAAPGVAFTDQEANRQNQAGGGENNPLFKINKDYNSSNTTSMDLQTNSPTRNKNLYNTLNSTSINIGSVK